MMIFLQFLLLVTGLASAANPVAVTQNIEVAITIDDLPGSGAKVEGLSRLQTAQEVIRTLKEAGLSGVYGFANGRGVKDSAELKNVLKLWRKSGHKIGNHTFAHSDLGTESAEAFIEDIQQNEILYKSFVPDKEFKVFRFPFLQEGETQEKRSKIRDYLFMKNYKIAEVSLDFEDWVWDAPYARCVKKKDEKSISLLKESFLQHALRRLEFAKAVSQLVFQRQIKHILLIHIRGVDAVFLKDLLKAFKGAGVKFISLAEAMKDPAYSQDPKFVAPAGKSYLLQHAETKGTDLPYIFPTPKKELEALCID